MRLRRTSLFGGLCALVLAVIACQPQRQRPRPTPTGGGEPPPVDSIAASSATSTGSASSSGSSSTTGTGAGGASSEIAHILTCADHETHVPDCESCRGAETQGLCTVEWQACLDDNYCSLGFFDCVSACTAGNQACVDACYTKQSTSKSAISNFVGCVCTQCASFCGG